MMLNILEVYRAIQGETSRVGLPVVIIRLAGCNLACRWCDTPESRAGEGTALPVAEVLELATRLAASPWHPDPTHFLVTGGEPLLQPGVHELLAGLLATGREVLLETNGSLDIGTVDERVVRIMDLKAPGSGMEQRNELANLARLGPGDELKLVLADRGDYEWARRMLTEHRLAAVATVLLSPVLETLEPRELAAWMIEDRLPARMQVQLHRVIWGPDARGV